MKTKKVAGVMIALERDFTCCIEYETKEELVSSVNEILFEVQDFTDLCAGDFTTIVLPDGDAYKWEPVLAHYCFGEGYISEKDLADELFRKENALSFSGEGGVS